MLVTVSIQVKGKVQGVFYRKSAREKAQELGLSGKVKNMEDGSVSIKATGSRDRIDQLIAWCWQGPLRAEVTGVDVKELPLELFDHFTIEK